MDIADTKYFRRWLKSLKGHDPEDLWRAFLSLEELPPLSFSNEVSAVYSANIEGNTIDLNTFLRSKARGRPASFKAREFQEIENLIEAYDFAQSHALNEKNLLAAHAILAETLLPKSDRGKYRRQAIGVYGRQGLEYVAIEPEYVAEAMSELFAGVRQLRRAALDVASVFYHASLLHLVFVHVHPFMDGNGRAARLLEKWFLASHLGREAWHVPSEAYYREHQAAYYRNIRIGLDYYTLDYNRCVPFLAMLPRSLLSALEG